MFLQVKDHVDINQMLKYYQSSFNNYVEGCFNVEALNNYLLSSQGDNKKILKVNACFVDAKTFTGYEEGIR